MDWLHRRRDDDLERELKAHLELEAEEHREAGLTERESQSAARRAFGNSTMVKEDVRRTWGWTRLEAMALDLRIAWRGICRNPGFALTAIVTLGCGIGASTAVFTVVDSVLLKPLPYGESSQLVAAWEYVASIGNEPLGPNPRHVDYWARRGDPAAEWTTVRGSVNGVSTGTESSRPLGTVFCQPNLFRVLGAVPALGRDFRPGEGGAGTAPVAILAWSAWQALFRGDPGVIGRVVRIDDVPREVVGVMPERFQFPNSNVLRPFRLAQPKAGVPEPWLFLPVPFDFSTMEWNGNYANWFTLGRLSPGLPIEKAAARLNAIQEQLRRELPGDANQQPGDLRASLQPMQEAIVGDASRGIWLLMAAVAGLLLIACLNLANAQLGRALASGRDAAIRAAHGAARWRLVWSALAETILLSLIGGALGAAAAFGAVKLLRTYPPVDLPRLGEVEVNPSVLLFSAAVTIATAFAAGLFPGLRSASVPPQLALQQAGTRTFGSRSGQRIRIWLIGLQVFGCTLLLLLTGLFSRSLLHLVTQDKGFETSRGAVAEVRLMQRHFRTPETRVRLIEGVLETLRASPGVESAAYFSAMPLEGESWIEVARRPDRRDQDPPLVNARWVSPGYFETTGQRLIAGRFFEERDRAQASIIISDSEATALWGSANPLGGEVNVLGKTFNVIGVVAGSRSTSLKVAPPRMVYIHYGYRPPGQIFFIARHRHSAEALLPLLRSAIADQSPYVTALRAKTLDTQVADSLANERFHTYVLGLFGISAVLLAMLGIYGILSYSVAARRQEIGVRIALGSSRGGVYWLTMREAGAPVLAGLLAGVAASLAASRIVGQFLYGTSPADPAVIVSVTALFMSAAAVAAFLPARQAAAIHPMEALRPQ